MGACHGQVLIVTLSPFGLTRFVKSFVAWLGLWGRSLTQWRLLWHLVTTPFRSAHCSAPCAFLFSFFIRCCGSSAEHSGSLSNTHTEVTSADYALRRHQSPQRPAQMGWVQCPCHSSGPNNLRGCYSPPSPLNRLRGSVQLSQHLDLLFELVLHNSLPSVRGDRHATTGGSECRRPSRRCRAAATAPTPRHSSCRWLA